MWRGGRLAPASGWVLAGSLKALNSRRGHGGRPAAEPNPGPAGPYADKETQQWEESGDRDEREETK